MNFQKLENLINNKLIKFYVLFLFLVHQLYYLTRVGTQIDEYVHIEGVELTLEKIKKIFNGSAFNEYLNYSDIEFYGYLYELQVYFFSNITILKKLTQYLNFVINEIDAVYFLRHFYLTIYVVVFFYTAHFFIIKILDIRAANIFIIILALNPIFIGHSMFNHKDISYSIHILLALVSYLYYSKKYILEKNIDNWKINFLTAFLIAYPILLRFNAVAFISLFIISYLIVNFKLLDKKLFFIKNIKLGIYILSIIILGSLPGWPNLIYYFKSLYNTQFKYAWQGNTVINGDYYFSTDFKFDYILKVLFYKLPIPTLLIMFLGIFTVLTSKNKVLKILYTFVALFFISFYLFKPTYYDYFRQYLFLIPIFSLMVAVIFREYFKEHFYFAIISLLFYISFSVYTQYGLEEFKYTYLNELTKEDEISNLYSDCLDGESICGQWSTDYYGVSGKQIIKKLQLENKNFVYSCFYDHTIDDFLFTSSNSVENLLDISLNDFNYIKRDFNLATNLLQNSFINEIYVIDIHRLGIGFCVDKFRKNYKCTIDSLVSKNYRSNEVFMAYVHKCFKF